MTESDMSGIIKNAREFLKKQYKGFLDCDWNEMDKCIVYQFTSDLDANQFALWKQTQGNKFRLEIKPHHQRLTVVREFRP
jgi:hypothetical protein